MTDTNKLRGLIIQKGFTQSDIAKRLGISYQSLSYKINNKAEFKVSEIEALCKILEIVDKDEYFFCGTNSQNG